TGTASAPRSVPTGVLGGQGLAPVPALEHASVTAPGRLGRRGRTVTRRPGAVLTAVFVAGHVCERSTSSAEGGRASTPPSTVGEVSTRLGV
ncbi:hypothetical protein QT969_21530, partial [Rhodococcus sp. CSLK01-03]